MVKLGYMNSELWNLCAVKNIMNMLPSIKVGVVCIIDMISHFSFLFYFLYKYFAQYMFVDFSYYFCSTDFVV